MVERVSHTLYWSGQSHNIILCTVLVVSVRVWVDQWQAPHRSKNRAEYARKLINRLLGHHTACSIKPDQVTSFDNTYIAVSHDSETDNRE